MDERKRAVEMPPPTADWSAFPQGYSLLLNEKAQFPQNLSCWRMKIDGRRQLFADTQLIAHSANLRRSLHPAQKHPANPLMKDLWAGYVYPEAEGGYRIYGNGWRGRFGGQPEPDPGQDWVWMVCSHDGIEWKLPGEVLQYREHGSDAWRPMRGQLHGLLFEPDDPDGEQRWKLILRDLARRRTADTTSRFSGPQLPIALYTSSDGLHWTWEADTTLVRKGSAGFRHTGGPDDVYPEGLGDVLQVRWDPALGKYIAHTKERVGPDPRFPFFYRHGENGPEGVYEARVAGWSESDDLIHWSPPRIYAYPDSVDASLEGMYGIYEADGFSYESMWLGCLSMTANVPDPGCEAPPRWPGGYKRNWIRLAGSRDGRHWYYLADREDFIPNGDHDAWDAHYIRMAEHVTCAGPVIHDDEVWFYYHGQYGGIPGCKGLTLPKSDWQCSLGLAVARRDGFVSLDADQEPGEVITRPLTFTGTGHLFLNAQTENAGAVRVAVLEEDGAPISGLEYDAGAELQGDMLRARVSWNGGDSLAALKGHYVRLAFKLQRAKMFSFWVE